MNIGIIGAGHIGSTAAELFMGAGHRVAISNSRGPETLAEVVRELGPDAQAMTAEDAAKFGEVVLEAVPYGHYRDLPAKALANKILISASNYYPQRDGDIDLGGRAQTELVAEYLPDTKVVKAFKHNLLGAPARPGRHVETYQRAARHLFGRGRRGSQGYGRWPYRGRRLRPARHGDAAREQGARARQRDLQQNDDGGGGQGLI